jgi:hypothetical protein
VEAMFHKRKQEMEEEVKEANLKALYFDNKEKRYKTKRLSRKDMEAIDSGLRAPTLSELEEVEEKYQCLYKKEGNHEKED